VYDNHDSLMVGGSCSVVRILTLSDLSRASKQQHLQLPGYSSISALKWGSGPAHGMACAAVLGSGVSTGRLTMWKQKEDATFSHECFRYSLPCGSLWDIDWHPSGDHMAMAASKKCPPFGLQL